MINIGVDLIDNSRFESMINDDKKVKRILSEFEQIIYSEITSDKRKIEYLASRFSAKEAVIKAINKENLSFSYSDISILNDKKGAPYVVFNFEVDFEVLISISHTDTNSVCFAILKKK